MGTDQIIMCVVALLLGMLLANMLKSVCGCKNVVEGQRGEAVVECAKTCIEEGNFPVVDDHLRMRESCINNAEKGLLGDVTPAMCADLWKPAVRDPYHRARYVCIGACRDAADASTDGAVEEDVGVNAALAAGYAH